MPKKRPATKRPDPPKKKAVVANTTATTGVNKITAFNILVLAGGKCVTPSLDQLREKSVIEISCSVAYYSWFPTDFQLRAAPYLKITITVTSRARKANNRV